MNQDDRTEQFAGYLETDEDTGPGALAPGARAELDAVRAVLADDAVWAEPPSGLVGALTAQISAERATVVPLRPRRERPWRPTGLLAVAAALVLVVGAAVVLAVSDDDPSQELALAGSELAPDAAGTVEVEDTPSGVAISLFVDGLPPAAPGTFYQAWVKGPDGSVPIGTFHARGDDGDPIELWSGVDRDDYPLMTVTIQDEGAGPESSGRVVLSGPITTE